MIRVVFACVALAIAAIASTASGGPRLKEPMDPGYTVEFRARFFRHADGEFETTDAMELGGWNAFSSTPIALVLVDVKGGSFPIHKGATLDFVARSKGRTLLQRWFRLGADYFSESSQISLPLLLYGLGCEPIQLSATLRVQGKTRTVRRTIQLNCGE